MSVRNDVDQILMDQPMNIGDLVVPVSDEYQLRSGCSYYSGAVVVSLDPFVLVSTLGDMRWGCTVKRENFYTVGQAEPATLKRCMRRIHS